MVRDKWMDGWRKRRPKAKRLPPKVKGQKFQFAAAFVDVVWTPCPAAFPWLLCCIIKFCRYGRRKTSCFPKTLTPSAADKRFNFNEISSTNSNSNGIQSAGERGESVPSPLHFTPIPQTPNKLSNASHCLPRCNQICRRMTLMT